MRRTVQRRLDVTPDRHRVLRAEPASLSGAGVLPVVVGLAMALLVVMTFMNPHRAPELGVIFAVAGLFWLLVMLGLGSLDSATRHDIPVTIRTES